MNNNPVGVFDSGIGGLSVVEEIKKILPHENLLYVADSKYAPYGAKSDELIFERSSAISEFLIHNKAKAVVVACNTATAAAITRLRQEFNLPFVGMEPAIKPAALLSKNKVIGILATAGTLQSDKYHKLSEKFNDKLRVISMPCPGLVERIERAEIKSAETYKLLEKYINPLKTAGVDQLVLGCTHYNLAESVIKKIAGSQINIVTTGKAVAAQLKNILTANNLQAKPDNKASLQLYSSANPENTAQIINKLFALNLKISQLDV